MKINWIVRFRNKAFWIGMIPAIAIVVKNVLMEYGVDADLTSIQHGMSIGFDIIFGIFAMLGIAVDPTTDGISDSKQARSYVYPKKDIDLKDV